MLISPCTAKLRAAQRSRRPRRVVTRTVGMYRPTNYLRTANPNLGSPALKGLFQIFRVRIEQKILLHLQLIAINQKFVFLIFLLGFPRGDFKDRAGLAFLLPGLEDSAILVLVHTED